MIKPKLYPSIEVINKRKPLPTEGERHLLTFLLKNLNDDYEIFYQPFLNGDLPDIIVMRKSGGLIIFEVKDWNLNNYETNPQGQWLIKNTCTGSNKNPLNQVMKYKNNLYNLHIDSLLDLKLKDYKYWKVVNCAIYFHCHTESESIQTCYGKNPNEKFKKFLDKNFKLASNFCSNCQNQHYNWIDEKCKICGAYRNSQSLILGRDSLSKDKLEKILDLSWINKRSKYFSEELYQSFSRILKPSIHTIEDGIEIKYSSIQKELSISEENARKRIKGVAGSGKSLVLAKRAVNAHKRTGGLVLILTFNITMRNYLHDKISAVRDDFSWEFFHISNYHDFITSNLNNLGYRISELIGKPPVDEDHEQETTNIDDLDTHIYSNLKLFSQMKPDFPKYDAIFIDETQDYKENWIRIIIECFSNDKCEIVAFADEKQNIYSRELDVNKMPVIPITVGAWDKRLNVSYRLADKIATVATDFQRKFFSSKYEIENKIDTGYKPMLFNDPIIEYHYLNSIEDKVIGDYIYKQILKNNFNSNDVTILSSRIKMLRGLNEQLKSLSKEKTNIMFETEEEFQKFVPNSFSGYETNKHINNIRKNRKTQFWMNRGSFKLSTIHSFKGWESPVLFLVIEDNLIDNKDLQISQSNRYKPFEFSNELVYTGITRCKDYLFIINLNNEAYHSFFANHYLINNYK